MRETENRVNRKTWRMRSPSLGASGTVDLDEWNCAELTTGRQGRTQPTWSCGCRSQYGRADGKDDSAASWQTHRWAIRTAITSTFANRTARGSWRTCPAGSGPSGSCGLPGSRPGRNWRGPGSRSGSGAVRKLIPPRFSTVRVGRGESYKEGRRKPRSLVAPSSTAQALATGTAVLRR